MSTSNGATRIGRETAAAAHLALELMLKEWQLTAAQWEEVAELLDELSAAVAAGDAATADAVTGELEILSGSRVTRIGNAPDGPSPESEGKVPLPEPYRERVVALVHALDPEPASGGARPAPPERT
ncbi:CATRA system-associated protein [Streptomyces longwoodensis]|uniref:CATRA system-associated protein n=1 Tax=Streptomyces longwoodensis TaxID=68231 RepID=UPI0033FA8EEE